MKKLYDIPRREHQVDQIRRYASLGRRFVSLQNSVRAIDGTSKNPISTIMTCQKFGTASGEEMAQFFADFLQRVADDMVDPPVAASTADVSPDRDILAEMTPGPFVHVGYDPGGGKETSVETMHYADGRILVTNVKVIDHSADVGPVKAFKRGDRVRKKSGSSWHGIVCGEYNTILTPEGYAVESEREPGSVQVYPAAALEAAVTPGGE